MGNFRQLLDEGKLDQAIDSVTAELRSHPEDLQLRTTLFELLCFSGKWDRAEKQLDVLGSGKDRRNGALVYLGAVSAERTREETVAGRKYGAAPEGTGFSGTVNGTRFTSISDADPRVGSRLEVYMGADCMWIPFEQIASIQIDPPKRLRDLIWSPAKLKLRAPEAGAGEGEVLLPVLSVFSGRHADPLVRLGRMTVWETDESGEDVPYGQKMLVVEGEEIPLLEIREVEFEHAAAMTES